jgi:AGZA family xanthine/uracil permease-like MFS transporter
LIELTDFSRAFSTDPNDAAAAAAARSGLVCLISIILIIILSYHEIQGAAVIGVLLATIIGIPMDVTDLGILAGKGQVTWKFWDTFNNYFAWDPAKGGVFFSCFRGFNFPAGSAMAVVMNVITLGTVDLFDTMGTIVGLSATPSLREEDGRPTQYSSVLYVDSVASVASGLLGTSSVTAYIESGSGITVGGRTGLVSVVVSLGFFLALFLQPIFAFIPVAAAASVLLYVGVLMVTTISAVNFTDIREVVVAFVTMTMMPFTYSITKGIGLGMLAHVILYAVCWLVDLVVWFAKGRKTNDKSPEWPLSLITLVIATLFIVYFFVPVG